MKTKMRGQASFGYQWEDRRLILHPEEAPVRKHMFELFVEHRRLKTVAKHLNEAGFRTRKGSPFSDTTVLRLLRDPLAKGAEKPIQAEPIVSTDLWEQCNQILDSRRKFGNRPARKTVHLFSGPLRCSCGFKMNKPSHSPKYVCRKCKNNVSVADLEEIFQQQLCFIGVSAADILKLVEETDSQIKTKKELLTSLLSEKRKAHRTIDGIFRLYHSGKISEEAFGRQYDQHEMRLGQIGKEIPSVQGQLDGLKDEVFSKGEFLNRKRTLRSIWEFLSPEEKQGLVENIVDTVVVGSGEMTFKLFSLQGLGTVNPKGNE